jgi:hypothetical protein
MKKGSCGRRGLFSGVGLFWLFMVEPAVAWCTGEKGGQAEGRRSLRRPRTVFRFHFNDTDMDFHFGTTASWRTAALWGGAVRMADEVFRP